MTAAPPALLVSRDGAVLHIRFNRPERLNALDPEMHEQVIDTLRAAATDPAVRTVAFSGEGRAFCAGENLAGGGRAVPERLRPRMVPLEIGSGPVLLHEVTTAIRNWPGPVVALLHGHALGAGYDYATSCDFRVVTEDCRLGDPRVHRALWAAEGWSYKITRLLAAGYTTKLHLLGEPLTGAEAYRIGLAHRLYPAGSDLRIIAGEFVQRLAALPAEAYAATKAAMLGELDRRWPVP